MPTAGKLRGRYSERHLVFLEIDDEQLELRAGNLLLFDARDAANAVSWVHDILVGTKSVSLLWFLLFSHYSRLTVNMLRLRQCR
jgi:hypothetical protein